MPNWRSVELGSVLPFKYGKSLPERNRNSTGDIDVVSSAGVSGKHDEAFVDEPCIVIGRKGSIGTVYYCPEPVWPIDTTFYATASDVIELKFAYYLLQTLPLGNMNNDSAVPGLNRAHAEAIEVALPSLGEQRAIAATLSALDDIIESKRRAIEIADELVRSKFSLLFDMNFEPDGDQFGDLVVVNPTRRLSGASTHPYVGMSDLGDFSPVINRWTFRPSGSGARFKNGDVLMARISPSLENGRTAVVDFLSDEEVAWGSTEFVVLAPSEHTSTAWVYCAVRSDEIRNFAIGAMTGSSGRQRFNAERLSSYRCKTPRLQALLEFDMLAVPLLGKIASLRDETLRLISLRDALLPELLSGRIRVDEAAA